MLFHTLNVCVLFYLFMFICSANSRSQPQLLCDKPNEFFDCGSYCDTTCATLGETCPVQTLVCVERCYCVPGYARDSNNNCIPIADCPHVCGLNEEYNPCPPSCPPEQSCQGIFTGLQVKCAAPNPNDVCKPSCRCKLGYVRNNDGVCIPPEQCCPINSEIVRCPNLCPGGTCRQRAYSPCRIRCPYKGCQCKAGYVMWSSTNKTCVPISSCPRNTRID